MRVTDKQVKVIKQEVISQFGEKVSVWLFGSRVDDEEKGGDIDRLVYSPFADPRCSYARGD